MRRQKRRPLPCKRNLRSGLPRCTCRGWRPGGVLPPREASEPRFASGPLLVAAYRRDCKCKAASFSRLAGDPDAAAVQLDEALRQREAQPRALALVQVAALDLPELLEYPFVVFGCDPDA